MTKTMSNYRIHEVIASRCLGRKTFTWESVLPDPQKEYENIETACGCTGGGHYQTIIRTAAPSGTPVPYSTTGNP